MKKQQPSNREQVVAVAAELFLLRGFAQTSMDDVVKESGVSKSNIYYHFASKEELVLAVVDQRIRLWTEQADTVLGRQELGVTERLERYLGLLSDELNGRNCTGGCPFVSLLTQAASLHESVRERLDRFFLEQEKMLAVMLKEGCHRGEVREDLNPLEAAELLLSAVEGAMVLAQTHRRAEVVERSGRMLLKLLRSPNKS